MPLINTDVTAASAAAFGAFRLEVENCPFWYITPFTVLGNLLLCRRLYITFATAV